MTTSYTGRHNTEKRGHTSMPRAGFEPAIPVFERSKTVRSLDGAATGTCTYMHTKFNLKISLKVATLDTVWYKKNIKLDLGEMEV